MSAERLSGLEQETLTQLNTLRASKGLRRLSLSSGLQAAAVAHSRSMLSDGYFEHESADGSPFDLRLRHYYPIAGYDGWTVGENLLYATVQLRAAAVISNWLASPPHRKNLLSPTWHEVGIGAAFASSAGGDFGGEPTMVITMDFGARSGGAPVVQKPARPKPAGRLISGKGRRVLPLPVAVLVGA